MERDQDLRSPVGGKLWETVEYHRSMLADGARNRAFRAAVERVLAARPGASVLDIGAGTGPWSIIAARAGASRVVAVERNPLMVPILRTLVADNGYAHIIRIIEGDSQKLGLDGPFDVLVSETIGSNAFDEDIVPIFADARRRFLTPSSTIVPRRLSLWAAPVACSARLSATAIGNGLDYSVASFVSLLNQFPTPVGSDDLVQLAAPVELVSVDLATAVTLPEMSALAAAWPHVEISKLEGVCVWFAVELCEDVTLTSLECPSWSQVMFPLERFATSTSTGHGALTFEHDRRPQSFGWTATLTPDGGAPLQQIASPHLGCAWIEVQRRLLR